MPQAPPDWLVDNWWLIDELAAAAREGRDNILVQARDLALTPD